MEKLVHITVDAIVAVPAEATIEEISEVAQDLVNGREEVVASLGNVTEIPQEKAEIILAAIALAAKLGG